MSWIESHRNLLKDPDGWIPVTKCSRAKQWASERLPRINQVQAFRKDDRVLLASDHSFLMLHLHPVLCTKNGFALASLPPLQVMTDFWSRDQLVGIAERFVNDGGQFRDRCTPFVYDQAEYKSLLGSWKELIKF